MVPGDARGRHRLCLLEAGAGSEPVPVGAGSWCCWLTLFHGLSFLVDSCHQAWSPGQGYENQVS